MTAPLSSHQLHVRYLFTEPLDAVSVAGIEAALPPDERARGRRFIFDRDRRDFVAAHHLLRRTLSTYGDLTPEAWTFVVDANGKPSLTPEGVSRPALTFNLSHTRGLVACAIAREIDVGVDVESIDRATDGLDIAERFFSPMELAMLSSCGAADRPARFIELWTLKESYLKSIGSGLAHPLDTFAFEFAGEHGLRFHAPPGVEAADWTFALYAPGAAHRLAIGGPAGQQTASAAIACVEAGAGTALAPMRST